MKQRYFSQEIKIVKFLFVNNMILFFPILTFYFLVLFKKMKIKNFYLQIRLRGMPVVDDIRMLRQIHLNMLVRVTGVVTVTTGLFFSLKYLF